MLERFCENVCEISVFGAWALCLSFGTCYEIDINHLYSTTCIVHKHKFVNIFYA